MSVPSGVNSANPALSDPDARVWMVEVDGNAYGPYSLNQVSRYLGESRVRPQSVLSSDQWPGQKWTVSEMMERIRSAVGTRPPEASPPTKEARPPSTPPQMPERTTEITKTLSRPVLTQARPEDDPATGLFEVLQTVRENKPAPRISAMAPQVAGVSKKANGASGASWKQPQRLLVLGVIAGVAIASMAVMVHWLRDAGNKMESVATQPAASTPLAGQPPRPASIAPASTTVVVPPKTTFKPAPRLILPPVPVQSAPPAPSQRHSASNTRDDQQDPRDLRDARDNDPRDANAPRDPRDFRDPREIQDARDPRDPRYMNDPRPEAAAPGADPNVPGDPYGNPQNSQEMPGGNPNQAN